MKHLILGAGGHAKVVLDVLLACGLDVAGLTDNDQNRCGRSVLGVPVSFEDDALKLHPPGSALLVNGVGLRDTTAPRARLYERLKALGYGFAVVKAPSAHVAASASLAPGSQILTRAVVHPSASIGENAVVNTGAIVEHDCVVGAHVFLGPAAVLCGNVKVGAGSFIGAGAVLVPEIEVGPNCLVAAGAVVTKNLPAGSKVSGIPAKSMP